MIDFRAAFSSICSIFFASLGAGSRLVGRLVLGTVTLTSGICDVRPGLLAGGSGLATGVGVFCAGAGAGRGGAGTTLVMPSGPSVLLFCVWRRRSPAPPGRGLKAFAAAAAFQKAPAISPLDFLALIIGPRPGRLSSGSGGGDMGDSTGDTGAGAGVIEGDGARGDGASCGVCFADTGGVSTGGLAGNAPGRSTLLASTGITVLALLSLNLGLSLTVVSPYGFSPGVVESTLRVEFLRGDILSVLRGGTVGSRRIPGLINGAGTRSLSGCSAVLKGSIGGRRLSGGFSSTGRGCSAGGVA